MGKTTLIIIAIAALSIGGLSWFLSGQLGPRALTGDASYIYPKFGTGGGATCGPATLSFYDINGNLHEAGHYVGDAPLYGQVTCGPVPEKILPAEAQSGKPFYPLHITVTAPADSISSDESFPLKVDATIAKDFDNNSLPVVINGDQILFYLYAVNFDISPVNSEARPHGIALGRSLSQEWTLTPTERALGKQSVVLEIVEPYPGMPPSTDTAYEGSVTQYDIALEVRNTLGISPALVAIFSAVGTFAVGLIAFTKQIPEVIKTVLEIRVLKTKGRNVRRKGKNLA